MSANQHEDISDLPCVNVSFLTKDKRRVDVKAPLGWSVLDVAHKHGVELEGACDSSLACSTCHVIMDRDAFEKCSKDAEGKDLISDRELDLLDSCPDLADTSRLGCQVKISEALKGATFRLPSSTVNMYVDGHVPQPH